MTYPLLHFRHDDVGGWFREHGIPILGAAALLVAGVLVVRHVVPRVLRPAVARQMAGRPAVEVDRRVETLSSVLVRSAESILVALAFFTVLPELGLDIRAVLAGVSITAIALGLGAQALVRDTLNGIFILSENQYAVGDVVTVAGVTGTVEDISLRRTVVRDVDGVMYTVPNGNVVVAANHTRDFARVRVQVPVSVAADLETVRRVADEVGAALAADPAYAGSILSAPRYLRVDAIDANGVSVQINGTVVPGKQWEIAGVLRARLLEAFQREGIKTPWG